MTQSEWDDQVRSVKAKITEIKKPYGQQVMQINSDQLKLRNEILAIKLKISELEQRKCELHREVEDKTSGFQKELEELYSIGHIGSDENSNTSKRLREQVS